MIKIFLFTFTALLSFEVFSQQKTSPPYEAKKAGEPYQLIEPGQLNKFQRIERNERAIQELYQKVEALEQKLNFVQNANKNGQTPPK